LKGKDEAATYILLCKDEISGLGGTLKIMKSDNGGEFTSTEFRREIQKQGISYETTAPYTSFQNGIAERSNRSQCELAVAMMLAASALSTYGVGQS
jgi:transposase InsO family protein